MQSSGVCSSAFRCMSRLVLSTNALSFSRTLEASAFRYSSQSASETANTGQPVVIRIPRRIQERIEHVKQIKRKSNQRVITSKPGKLLIKSKDPRFNQSAGYTLGKFQQPVLASKGWKHNKSFGDYFTINSTQEVPPCITESKQEETEHTVKKTFNSFKLCPEIVEFLQNNNIIYPTTVQQKTIPKLLRGHNILCAAETGSGKTLGYLLPIVEKLQADSGTAEFESDPHIRSVILVPSRELAEQVTSVAKALASLFDLKVKVVGGGRGIGNIKVAFKNGPPDILVATPGALYKALRRRCLDMTLLSFLVIDEADTMFDPSFSGLVESILTYVRVASSPSETVGPGHKAQLAVVGATFPGGVGEVLSQVTDLGSVLTVRSRMLHFLMPHVKQTFLKVRGADKLLELHQELKKTREGLGVLVFCNSSATVNWLGYTLEDLGVRHVRLQGEMPAPMRAGIFQSFQKGLVDVLVCTDIASRGLDTQRVGVVVNYDFPESHTDYIHRAGRVGRAGSGSDGAVLSFVTHPWDVELVQAIETAARRRISLPGMEKTIHEPAPRLIPDDCH
ncbi:probable ATP-dependent RNA helicase DDX28 [Brienomyrus brachyistius]|uniref:probable ATP-dependent RNA helicase DDX28 n=1 Tax=Brienomyrus brachyistius TaxID=42636 RepID=UPI0020B17AC1|nr:probable ATP-dependent RNA helicase DDX28 [Brienomyrus brachyistius]